MKKYYLCDVYRDSDLVAKVHVRPKQLSSFVNKCLDRRQTVVVDSIVYIGVVSISNPSNHEYEE